MLSFVSKTYGKNWDISPGDKINWNKVENGDVVCLSGIRKDSLLVKKNITIDGNCYSKMPATLSGLITPKWAKVGANWMTVDSFPLDNSRHAAWVLLNGKLTDLNDAKIYRKGEFFYSKIKPLNIKIPKYYSAIIAKGTDGLVIKNLNISYYHTHGIRISDSKNSVIDNVFVSWIGGGINPRGFPRAGDGITFDGNTSDALIINSSVSQCFDTGFTMQLFKDFEQYANGLRFINVNVDKCGAGLSVAVHKKSSSKIDDVEIVGNFTNLGYGWSGVDNSVHGRGVMIKQYNSSKITNIKLHDSVIDTFSWVGVLQYSGELDAWNNTIKNGTGEYVKDKYIKPAAYTAHGVDYTRESSDDEAVGLFHKNKILNNKAFAFQIIHNRPKVSTRQLTIKDNLIIGNVNTYNIKTSNEALH